MSASPSLEWQAGVRQVHEESGGLVTVAIVTREARLELLAAVVLGDHEASTILRAIADCSKWIAKTPRKRPVLCVCCPRPVLRVTRDTIIGVASPATTAPNRALGFAFCRECGKGTAPELTDRARRGLSGIWPDLRPVAVTHPQGGRA